MSISNPTYDKGIYEEISLPVISEPNPLYGKISDPSSKEFPYKSGRDDFPKKKTEVDHEYDNII